jgi:hypothetical protein
MRSAGITELMHKCHEELVERDKDKCALEQHSTGAF